MNRSIVRSWCWIALVLSACKGDGGTGETGDTGVSSTSSGGADSTITGDEPGVTTSGTSETTATTAGPDSSTGGPTPTTAGETDTGGDSLVCPLAAGPGVQVLTLSPALFADGVDPSGSEECAHVNPERGFFQFTDLRSLDVGNLEVVASQGLSLVYGKVLIPEYRESPLDAQLLATLDASFDLIRAHGLKVIPRFHYSDDGDEPDAELAVILGHIEQLAPLLQAHADVIVTMHAGFIGAWGEWHSSQHGLDAPGPRKQILDALLAALPPERTVSVRRPSFKQDAYGEALTPDTAHDGSARARTGHVNDCFLASETDQGTYEVPGEKDYAITDSAFVPMGGETCAVNPPRTECPAAMAEMQLLHWNHLNLAYNTDVIDGWHAGGCFEQIACRLGYRLAVRELQWAASAAAGGTLPVSLRIYNDGFAAPVNRRSLVLVLDGPTRVELPVDVDARDWHAGTETTLCVDAPLPGDLAPGDYRIGLRLPDLAASLADDPRQSIRLVNGTWDPQDATNWFDANVTIE